MLYDVPRAELVMNVLTLPMFFLSGALYPLRGLPPWLSFLSHIDPLSYGVDALRGVIYADGTAVRALVQYPLALDLAVLAGAAILLAFAAAWSFETQQT